MASNYLYVLSKEMIDGSFESFWGRNFLATENRSAKLFGSADKARGPRSSLDTVSRSSLKKCPECRLSCRGTRPVPLIDWPVAENVKILSFCHRKGTIMA